MYFRLSFRAERIHSTVSFLMARIALDSDLSYESIIEHTAESSASLDFLWTRAIFSPRSLLKVSGIP